MSKALLQQHAAKAIREREQQEKAIAAQIARRSSEEKPSATVKLPVQSLVPSPTPIYIQKTIVYPAPDNIALIKERAEKEKAAELYSLEKTAREKSHQRHQEELERIKQVAKEQLEAEQRDRIKAEELQREELERNKQLVKEDTSLKRRHDIVLEKNKVDDETIQRITEENEALKLELEKARKAPEETKLPNETSEQEGDNKVNIAVPPPYDNEQDVPEISDLTLNAPHNETSLAGEVAPESPVEDSDKCAIS
jgi:hypothetical protein